MKIPAQRIEGAVSDDKTRWVLTNVMLDGDRLVATDGRLLVSIPVEREPGDVDGMISKEAMNAARGSLTKSLKLSKRFAKATRNRVTQIFEREQEGTFPSWKVLLPKEDAKPIVKIGINPHILMKCFKALSMCPNRDTVILEIMGEKEAIRVRATSDPEKGLALVMPVYVQ